MARWLNVSPVRFLERRAVLRIPDRVLTRSARTLVDRLAEVDPAMLEEMVRQIVLVHRPELAACSIFYFAYDPRLMGWEVGVAHPSFDPVPEGEAAPSVPLVLGPGETPMPALPGPQEGS